MGLRGIVAASLLVFLPAAAAAGEDALTLDDVMRLASENARAVRIRGHEVRKATWQHASALSNVGPKLAGSYDFQRWDSEIRFDLPPEFQALAGDSTVIRPIHNWQLSISVVQPVTGLLTIGFASHLAKLGVDQARLAEALERRNARTQAIDAFYGVLKAERALETLLAAERSAMAYLDQVRRFFEQGMAKQDDVLRIEVRLEQVRQGIANARVGLDVARSQLALLIGRPLGSEFRLADSREAPSMDEPLEKLEAEALESRFEVQQARLGVRMAKTARVVKGLEVVPSVNGIFTYTRAKETGFSEPESWFVGVNVSWTAFEWGRRVFDVAAASADVAAAREAAAQVEDMVRLDVRAAWLATRAAAENIARAELAVRQARENQRIQGERARENLGTTTDLLDAEALVVQAESDRDAALYGYQAARRKLLETVGR